MKRLVLSTLVFALVFGAGGWWLHQTLNQSLSLPSGGIRFTVAAGDHLSSVLSRLHRQNRLQQPEIIGWWAKWQGLDRGLQVGDYALEPPLTPDGLLRKLNRGDVIQYSVTLPEGITLAEAIIRIQQAEGVEPILNGPDDPRLLALVKPHPSAEGWFLPETYQYPRGTTDLAILRRAQSHLRSTLDTAWAARQSGLPLKTPYDALILASIVERETAVPDERATIAGVFIRRLERGMRLQTDPTVIYGLGPSYQGNLTRAHLRDSGNKWNTYRISGLPPTPIALPGVDSIHATLHPDSGTALYFVAKGDGHHAFSSTIEEHNAKVKRYQLSRDDNYRSTPSATP